MEGGATGGRVVRVVSRRMVRPSTPPLKGELEVIHLTPLDLRLIRTDSIQKGILLPKPPPAAALESSFARALRLFYPFAGRLAAAERGDGTVTVSLRCTGEGAEFVHAAAPGVAAADIVSSVYTPSVVRDELHSFDPALGADAAVEALPLVSVQVTELADGVFVGVTLNHAVADGAALWHFVNTWAEIHRRGVGAGGDDDPRQLSTPAPVFQRWFVDTWPVPIPLPFGKLGDIARQVERATVREAFLIFSTASVSKLTARANGEVAGTATATAAISPLQAVLAHLWRAVCRARRMPPEQGTSYSVLIDCRGRVKGMPPGYVGNTATFGKAEATVGEIDSKGLGWTAWLLSRAEASFDEASVRESAGRWVRQPALMFISDLSSAGTALATGSSPWPDVFGNDFGWGRPVTMRSGAGNKTDGKAAVFEGPERGGGMSLELCLAPDALERLLADEEFMDAVSLPARGSTEQ
ncbi:putative acetyltransferase [Panicum miliaceum]|uniref:Acetyltransferase n=1 Tax=Panicum miliaceum TaxID=4540 RepID=A0A3L6RJP2_PANMI|nr:putative acetyltransferase [Panicum miliaceum]